MCDLASCLGPRSYREMFFFLGKKREFVTITLLSVAPRLHVYNYENLDQMFSDKWGRNALDCNAQRTAHTMSMRSPPSIVTDASARSN